MLFHLAHPFIRGRGPIQVEGALERLVDRHGNGNYLDCTLKLTFPRHPGGLYLIKGSGSDVWQRFRVPPKWRKPQGLIHGKRCGTTQNIGASLKSIDANLSLPLRWCAQLLFLALTSPADGVTTVPVYRNSRPSSLYRTNSIRRGGGGGIRVEQKTRVGPTMTQVESNGQALACEKKADADPAKVLTMYEGGAWRITSQSCRGCC